jgi:ABC-type dipeptide/oligopeptide/nickel transport system permease component
VLFMGVVFLAVNFVADLFYLWLDPRIRYGKRP